MPAACAPETESRLFLVRRSVQKICPGSWTDDFTALLPVLLLALLTPRVLCRRLLCAAKPSPTPCK